MASASALLLASQKSGRCPVESGWLLIDSVDFGRYGRVSRSLVLMMTVPDGLLLLLVTKVAFGRFEERTLDGVVLCDGRK